MTTPAAPTPEERLAAARREVEELTAETLHLYRQVNLLYRIGDAIAEMAEAEDICRLVLRECVRILRARGGRVELADGQSFGTPPPEGAETLTVSIETRNGAIGTLSVHDTADRFFSAADGKLVQAVARQAGVAIDNTRLVQGLIQKNEELKALDQMKNEFVRNVSHELRTPLASIKGFSATIQQDPEMPVDTVREFVGIINDEADKLVIIVNDILDLSAIMAGHMRYARVGQPLEPLVLDVVRLLKVLAAEKGIELTCEIVDPARVEVDGTRIAQVFKNLVGNGIKFTDAGGVHVRQWVADGQVHVSVTDTGDGIPADQIPKIFEDFYRVARPAGGRQLREGTGLGLALVRAIVAAHGARLEVQSEVDRGSVFTVHLPLAAGEGA